MLKWMIIAVLAGYGCLLAFMYVFQRSLQYFPDPVRTSPAQAGLPQAEEVSLRSADGETLVAWHVPPRDGKPVVLYLHGNAGALNLRVNRFAWLTRDGYGLVALSYRGYGGSTGKPTEAGLILDAQAAHDFAAARYEAKRLVPWGESLGTGVAVALAAMNSTGAVVLDAPFTSAADVGATVYPLLPVRWLMKDQFRSDRLIGRIRAPLLVIHGVRDNVVPIGFGERLFALANEPKRFVRIPTGNHVDLDDHGAIVVVREFLSRIAAGP